MYTLLLDDSEVREVRLVRDTSVTLGSSCALTSSMRLAVEMSAARVLRREDGCPTEGYLAPLTLWLDDACWTVSDDSDLADCYGTISDGSLMIGSDGHAGHALLTLPLTHQGAITLSLRMRARASWQFTATGIRIEPTPDAQFRESMAC